MFQARRRFTTATQEAFYTLNLQRGKQKYYVGKTCNKGIKIQYCKGTDKHKQGKVKGNINRLHTLAEVCFSWFKRQNVII